MPGDMSHDEKDPLFVMNSLSDRPQDWYLHSTEDLEDHHSTTSSTESNPSHLGPRKDHEFIPTRMKTISASKPAADPSQFTRVNSNPLLISAQKQLMKVEEVKKKAQAQKEVIRKVGGDDQPDWQDNLSSWKDRRRKQSEEALMRVAEVKALDDQGDDSNQQKKRSIGKKLSTLLYTDEDEMDWSDLGLEKANNNAIGNGSRVDFEDPDNPPHENPPVVDLAKAPRRSLPAGGNLGNIREAMTPEPVQQDLWPPQNTPGHVPAGEEKPETEPDFGIEAVKTASRTPAGYGEGIPVLNRKTSAPVLPYGSPARAISEEKEPPSVRRKSSELSLSMKARLGAFTGKQDLEDDAAANKRIVEPDNTFREKLQTFRKISEPQPEDSVPKGPKPPLSYKTLIGNNFSQTTTAPNPAMIAEHEVHEDHEDYVEQDDSVDQLLDDALEESFNLVEDENHAGSNIQDHSGSILADDPILPVVQGSKKSLPPTEKPPPPPISEVMTSEMEISAKNQRNLQKSAKADEDIDKQEQEIIASLELEEREHKKYMDTVNAYRNFSPTSSASSSADNAGNGSSSSRLGPQPFGGKKSDLASPTFGSVSPALSSDSRGGQIQSPSNSNSGPPKSKKSSPGQSVMAEPSTTTNNTPPGRSSSSQGQPPNSSQQPPQNSYNQQHWLIQEAEQRRIAEHQMRHYQQQHPSSQQQQQQSPVYENSNYLGGMQMPHVPPPSQYTNHQRPPPGPPTNGMTPPGQPGQPGQAGQPPPQQPPPVQPPPQRHHQQPSPNENMYANLGQHPQLPPNFQRDIPPGPPPPSSNMRGLPGPQVPPRNPPAGSGGEGTGSSTGGSSDRLLSVSGKKKCSHCKEELGRGAAMIIESLRLFYHLRCFRCVVCHVQLGNGSSGTDVRVRNNKLHCQNCYSNDEGLKFSKV